MRIVLLMILLLNGWSGSAEAHKTAIPAPVMGQTPAQGGAVLVTITGEAPEAVIHYTLDGSAPTPSSQIYQAPFLVASSLTVRAMATAGGTSNSRVVSQTFTPKVDAGALVWSDEFTAQGSVPGEPNPGVWVYDVGKNCCGNNELETYCAWGSTSAPCDPSSPNAYVGADGYLHVVARKTAGNEYTSARLKSQGKFSFQYGRIEARMKLPESQGMWPAFWTLGNNIAKLGWPGCGELDIMEHIDGNDPPFAVGQATPGYDWMAGSVHFGPSGNAEINGTQKYHPDGFSATEWHTYGMIWKKGLIEFYVDDAKHPYATFRSGDAQFAGGKWPFDDGPQFVILNLAVGGDWPGNPDANTVFPSDMLVDYVRIYAD